MSEQRGDQQADGAAQQIKPLPANVVIENKKGEQEEKGSRAHQEAHTKTANSLPRPSFFQRFMHKHFPEARPHDRWTLVFTAVIAGSTFLYTIFAGWTLYEIRSGSADTHDLAVAAKKQADHTGAMADAANKISGAADKFSASADAINQETKNAVGKFDRMAKASEQSLQTSQRNAQQSLDATISASQLDQRAWIGIAAFRLTQFELGKPIKIEMDFSNSGKTPAIGTYSGESYVIYPVLRVGPTMTELMGVTFHPVEGIAPQGKYTNHFEAPPDKILPEWVSIQSGKAFLYVYGSILYSDIFSKTTIHETQFCVRLTEADTPTPRLIFCDTHNDMN